MGTKLKFFSIFALCIMILSNICNANVLDSFSIDDEKKELTICGTPDGTIAGDNITIQILKQGKTKDTVSAVNTKESIMSDFILLTQVLADANGGYTKTVSMVDEEPGFYSIRINGMDTEIYYATKTDKENIITSIKTNCMVSEAISEADAISYLKTNFDLKNKKSVWRKSFDLSDNIIDIVTEDGLFKVFLGCISELTSDNLKENMIFSACVTALNENKIDVFEYKEFFEIDSVFVELYDTWLTSTAKSVFCEKYYKNKNYENKTSIQTAFKDGVINSNVMLFEGADAVEEYITKFGIITGIETDFEDGYGSLTTSEKNAVKKYVLSENYDTCKKIADAVNYAIKNIDKLTKNYNSGISSGNSGGSGGAVGGTTVTKPVIPTPSVEEDETKLSGIRAFSDMTDFDWAVESVETLAAKGIVSGTGNGKYEPERNVTREEILVMILRAFEIEISNAASNFTDALADEWYTSYLATAKTAGYVQGKTDGSFGVGEAVTRQDAAVMAYNIARAKGLAFTTEKVEVFADDKDIEDYAIEAVYALKNAEVLKGKGEGLFDPIANCTRAEAAKIIYTLIK